VDEAMMNIRHLTTAAMAALAFANVVQTQAIAQHQATRVQLLTTLPVHQGYEKIGAIEQLPNKGQLVVARGMHIQPPHAWNREDKYVAPNFNDFFPDDPAGGKQLDALFTGRMGGHHAPEDLLAAVRQGLRRTRVYKSQLLGQIGSFVWNAKQQDPRARVTVSCGRRSRPGGT